MIESPACGAQDPVDGDGKRLGLRITRIVGLLRLLDSR